MSRIIESIPRAEYSGLERLLNRSGLENRDSNSNAPDEALARGRERTLRDIESDVGARLARKMIIKDRRNAPRSR